jgi:hypothetical protein
MLKAVAGALCVFELGALATGRYPTLTQLSARYPWLKWVLIAALVVHLHGEPRPVPADRS